MTITLPADSSESCGTTPHACKTRLVPPPIFTTRLTQVQEIYATYSLTPDASHCFFDGSGHLVQLALRLTRGTDALTVVCKWVQGDDLWFITDVSHAAFEPGAYIAAVRARLAADWQISVLPSSHRPVPGGLSTHAETRLKTGGAHAS